MPVAMKRVESIGWLALVLLIAVLLYPLSLNVATMRSDLDRTDAAIVGAEREIGYLEAELRARASHARLEEWNELYYGYEPPVARQFLEGETALAGLGDSPSPAPAAPILVTASIDGVAPAGEIGSTVPSVEDAAETRARRSALAAAAMPAPSAPAANAPETPRARTERIATLESKLLSPAMLARIEAEAGKENRRP